MDINTSEAALMAACKQMKQESPDFMSLLINFDTNEETGVGDKDGAEVDKYGRDNEKLQKEAYERKKGREFEEYESVQEHYNTFMFKNTIGFSIEEFD